MSQCSEAKTYQDLLVLFDSVGEALHSSRLKLPYADIDARHVALRGMQEIVGGYAMGFSSMIYSRTQDEILKSFGRYNLSPDEARRIIEDAWKNGLLTLFHFKLDSLLQNLLRALNKYNRRQFAHMVGQIAELFATRAERDRLKDVFLLCGYLRNSFHNNGIHRGPELAMTISDMEYHLKPEKAVDCDSWGHVFALMLEVIINIDTLLRAPTIQALSAPIPDQYALNPVT